MTDGLRGTIDEHYLDPRLAGLYDLDSPWSIDRDFYLALAGSLHRDILDLGCGTGLLCNAYAERGHRVTGVDPSPAMLEIARRKPHSDRIEWVQAFGHSFKSERRYDLIIMTGHAFQAILEDADIERTLRAMKEHLRDDGTIVFESRNPAIDWSQNWNYEMVLATPQGDVRASRRLIEFIGSGPHPDRMSFELIYEFPDRTITTQSELRFLSLTRIKEHLSASGLHADKVWGDWMSNPFDEQTSEEMIFSITKRRDLSI